MPPVSLPYLRLSREDEPVQISDIWCEKKLYMEAEFALMVWRLKRTRWREIERAEVHLLLQKLSKPLL